MADILILSDFSAPGRFFVSLNTNNEAGLEDYISRVQDDFLNKLLGCDLATLFKNDLNNDTPPVPQDPIYIKIFEPFCIDDTFFCGPLVSKGMREMLQGFTFWYYMRDNQNKRTTSGAKKNKAENSDSITLSAMGLSSFWNSANSTYKAIQDYICRIAPEDYPAFNGVRNEDVSPF